MLAHGGAALLPVRHRCEVEGVLQLHREQVPLDQANPTVQFLPVIKPERHFLAKFGRFALAGNCAHAELRRPANGNVDILERFA